MFRKDAFKPAEIKGSKPSDGRIPHPKLRRKGWKADFIIQKEANSEDVTQPDEPVAAINKLLNVFGEDQEMQQIIMLSLTSKRQSV